MAKIKDLVIIGAGGLGREIAAMVDSCFSEEFNLVGFVDDGKMPHDTVNGKYIRGGIGWLLEQRDIAVVFGIGAPATKQKIYQQLEENKSLTFPNMIHPEARLHNKLFIKLGEGNVITDGCILTTNISIGDFNLINLSSTIGHDVVIGDFCSIMPGVNISGGAELHDVVYIGTGAKLIKATRVGQGAVVGAGAVVHADVPSETTFVDIPAKTN